MEISQLLPANGTSSAPKGSQGAKTDSEDFARMLKQSGEAASGKKLRDDAAASEPGNDSLAKAANDNETAAEAPNNTSSAEQLPEAVAANVTITVAETLVRTPDAQTPAAGTPAGLAPLTQNIAKAMLAQSAGQPVAAGTQETMLKGTQLAFNGSETFDLATIRERLTTIANAQRGSSTLPSQAVASLVATSHDSGKIAPSMGDMTGAKTLDGDIVKLLGQTAALRPQQLATQNVQQVSTQNVSTTLASSGQSATFMEAVAANPTAASDLPLSGRGSHENGTGQTQVLAGNITGTSPGSAGQAQGASAPTQVLNAPLATAQWQQGLGQQLVSLHQRGAQQMELHLRPADLGPLTISLKVDDQLAQAQFFSANPQVRAAIELAIPQLREALEESGIQLGEAMVGEQRQQGNGDSRADDTALASGDSDSPAVSADEALDIAATGNRTLTDNGNAVDLYA